MNFSRSRNQHPGIASGVALLVALGLQLPRWLEEDIEPSCIAVTLNSTANINEEDECDCSPSEPLDGLECKWVEVVRQDVRGRYPWVTYVILTELFVKILPTVLLLTFNFLMADRFYHIVEQRRILRARNFVSGSGQLLAGTDGAGSEVGKAQDGKGLAQNCSLTSLNPGSTRQRSFLVGIKTFSDKDKNIITLLFFLTLIFMLTNIPMAGARIMQAFGQTSLNPLFNCIVNILEVSFAASNFYLYCLCNARIREKVITIQYYLGFWSHLQMTGFITMSVV